MRFLGIAALAAGFLLMAPSAAESSHDVRAHGFDWEIGTWKTDVKVLANPMSGKPAEWAHYSGTSVVKPLLDGRANFVELKVSGPTGRIDGGSLRLFSPKTGQWSLNYANLRNGLLTSPTFGNFDRTGRGVFFGTDDVNGKTVLVRFIITRKSASTVQFEQAFSADAGSSWEENWIAIDTRL